MRSYRTQAICNTPQQNNIIIPVKMHKQRCKLLGKKYPPRTSIHCFIPSKLSHNPISDQPKEANKDYIDKRRTFGFLGLLPSLDHSGVAFRRGIRLWTHGYEGMETESDRRSRRMEKKEGIERGTRNRRNSSGPNPPERERREREKEASFDLGKSGIQI